MKQYSFSQGLLLILSMLYSCQQKPALQNILNGIWVIDSTIQYKNGTTEIQRADGTYCEFNEYGDWVTFSSDSIISVYPFIAEDSTIKEFYTKDTLSSNYSLYKVLYCHKYMMALRCNYGNGEGTYTYYLSKTNYTNNKEVIKDKPATASVTYHSPYQYNIAIPEAYEQVTDDVLLKMQEALKSQTGVSTKKVINEAVFVPKEGSDEFPRIHITYLPLDNYDNVSFAESIQAFFNRSLPDQMQDAEEQFAAITVASASHPVIDNSKQSFLFSFHGSVLDQSVKYGISSNTFTTKGLISINVYAREEQQQKAEELFKGIYQSLQVNESFRLHDR